MQPNVYCSDQLFEKRLFTDDPLPKGDYENCIFDWCTLTELNLSGYKFSNCTFKTCNLSMVKLHNTVLNEVAFLDCKLLGIRFETCDRFGFSVSFDTCLLDYASFYQCNLAKTVFKKTQCVQVDFTETNLTLAIFEDCNLEKAVFERTNLEKADLRTAHRFSIDPEQNNMKRAKFSYSGISGLLNKYNLDIEW